MLILKNSLMSVNWGFGGVSQAYMSSEDDEAIGHPKATVRNENFKKIPQNDFGWP